MALSKQEFTNYIRQFQFREMFNYMGWDNDTTSLPIVVDNITYDLKAVAKKHGFKILLCNAANDNIPDYNIRKKIETKVTKSFQEHLLIFTDSKKQEQVWQLVVRHKDKPNKITETRYHISQDPELIYQRASGIFFELDEEEHITIIDVTKRVEANFHQNNERVTKQFYEKFKQQHTAFLKFIKGIDDKVNHEWYASLMLNRLMFCYFIQKKGFLDDNKNYLRDKLKACQVKKGKNKFYSFYRDFLLQLFHEGLGAPDHSKELKEEIGKIPYLNGGLFDTHEIERNYKELSIDDKAFEKIFDFFDQYEWHLDTRHTASGRDINPDVIGYIFEKYINDRAQMGAYYTKEDITDYISKNCILPFLFDETKRNYAKAFLPEAELWQMVKTSGDKYIYDAVKKGVNEKLPDQIAAGIKDVSKRTEWNRPATENFALPTEIWREVVDRRNRYTEIKTKIDKGEIQNINDFITYNLNIRQFAVDAVANTNDPDFLRTFYKALSSVTIIDPTCGSGAFLFAAMNILEELYEQCIQRMQNFVSDAPNGKYKFFEETIAQVTAPEHPNLQYFIYKNIILKNLYGVDIMKEAVEIAKLRLFLKLVATVQADYRKPNLGLEPLPDIDFNIRSGNTLVGFATEVELDRALTYTLDGQLAKPAIKEKMEIVAMTFKNFKNDQVTVKNYRTIKDDKATLEKRLKQLNHELNLLLHKQEEGLEYDKWLESSKPFHWFAEFYEIVSGKKGFDVIIGNPPYVEYSSVRKNYLIKNFECLSSSNLYSFVIERAIRIQRDGSYNGMIIPLSAYCTDRMDSFQKIQYANCSELFISYYAERPGKLFEGAERNLAIALFKKEAKAKTSKIYTTYYYKWNSNSRQFLFQNISYTESKATIVTGIIPKISSDEELSIIKTLRKVKKNVGYYTSRTSSKYTLYYRNSGGRYWKIITDFQPTFYLNSKKGISSRESYLYFNDSDTLKMIVAILNSTTYYWYYVMHSDARTNNPSDLKEFPIDIESISDKTKKKLISNCDRLMKDIDSNSIMQPAKYQTGNVEFQQFFPQKSKSIIDEIDTALADHYGFTEEELDFIINYDIKYRMGKELENGEDEE